MEAFRQECSAIAPTRQAEQEALENKYLDLYAQAEQSHTSGSMGVFREEWNSIALSRQAEQKALDKKYQDLYAEVEERLQRALDGEDPGDMRHTANLNLKTFAESGDTTAVFMTLAKGASVDHVDENSFNGFSALMLAAYSGQPATVRALLEVRASTDLQVLHEPYH